MSKQRWLPNLSSFDRSFKMAWKGLQSVISFSKPIVLIGGVDKIFLYAYIAECVAKRTRLKQSTSARMENF